MAVDDTTTTDEPEEVAEETAEVENESEDSVDLEDMEVSEDELVDESKEEPETESESEESEEETPEETEELSDEDKQKQHNREMAERRIQEKATRDAKIKQDQADYIAQSAENRDPLELAVRQLQVSEYNNTVTANTNKLTNDYERAVKDFDILSSDDPAIKAEVDSLIDAFQAQHVKIDAYGNPTDVSGDLYKALQTKADSISQLTGIREKQQVQSKTKEKSKVLATPSRAPKEPKVDPDMAAFDEEANKY